MKSTQYQPKTGAKCSCKRGVYRDNCPNCEGTGWVIDFKAIHDRREEKISYKLAQERYFENGPVRIEKHN
jgi:hypothetical protein